LTCVLWGNILSCKLLYRHFHHECTRNRSFRSYPLTKEDGGCLGVKIPHKGLNQTKTSYWQDLLLIRTSIDLFNNVNNTVNFYLQICTKTLITLVARWSHRECLLIWQLFAYTGQAWRVISVRGIVTYQHGGLAPIVYYILYTHI